MCMLDFIKKNIHINIRYIRYRLTLTKIKYTHWIRYISFIGTHTIQIQTPTLTLTNVPVKLVPSPRLSASSSIRSAIDFLIAETSTFDSALASTTAGDRDSANNAPVAAAGAAYRLPRRVAAEIMLWIRILDFRIWI